ncbi:MAG: CBS domain-containing protein [Nitrospira sp.]|nr:CBS domain-containing protein [Nitrospira sp.]
MEPTVQFPSTELTAGAVMSAHVVTVTMDDSLATIRRLFQEHHFHHLLVVERGELVGIISDRDLLKAISPNIGTLSETDRDRATLNKRAHHIMTRNPVTVRTTTSIETAAALMLEKNVSCLPITSDDRHLKGILTWRDILRALISPARLRS